MHEKFPHNLEKACLKFSLRCVIRVSLLGGTLWVSGFELCNWASLRGLELGEMVSIRKNVCGLNVVMVTDTVIKSVRSSFSIAADFGEKNCTVTTLT